MKTLIIITTLIMATGLFAQEKGEHKTEQKDKSVEIAFKSEKEKEKAVEDGLDPNQIGSVIEKSRKDLVTKFGEDKVAKLKPVGISYQFVDPITNEPIEMKQLGPTQNCGCETKFDFTTIDEANKRIKELNKVIAETYKEGPKGILFIHWGYNRGFHSKSDITIKTDEGNIIIRDAVGEDRPSEFSLRYLNPKHFSKPQYNLKIGYWFSDKSKFGVAIGTDHMKWVFDNTRDYVIEGDYTGNLWLGGQNADLQTAIANNDASFLLLEHTDGHNYHYVEGLYREILFDSKRFRIDATFGASLGLHVPRTRTRIRDQDTTGAYRDLDNKFHIAGWGFGLDAGLVFKYKLKNGVSYFVKPNYRFTGAKLNDVLYFADEGSISQSWIMTQEPSLSFGAEIPLNIIARNPARKNAKSQKKQIEKWIKLEKKNEKTKLSLEELDKKIKAGEDVSQYEY